MGESAEEEESVDREEEEPKPLELSVFSAGELTQTNTRVVARKKSSGFD